MRKEWTGVLILIVLTLLGSTTAVAQTKGDLVVKLLEQTFNSHPSVMKRFSAGRKAELEKSAAEKRRVYGDLLKNALAQNSELDSRRKDFAKTNLETLVDHLAFEVLVIQSRNKDENEWLRHSLYRNYSAKFTMAELKRLTVFFAGIKGEKALRYIAGSPERQESEEINYSPDEFLAYNAFVIKTALGKKFFNVFVIDSQNELNSKNVIADKQILAETSQITGTLSLNRIITRFVTENIEAASTDKAVLINKFIDAFVNLENESAKEYSKSFNDPRMVDNLEETHSEMFDAALKENTSLSAAQKSFAKANYDKLSGILAAKQRLYGEELIRNTNKATAGHLRSEIMKYLSITELTSISAVLEKPEAVISTLLKPDISANQTANPVFEEFAKTMAGSKIVTIVKDRLPELTELTLRDEGQKYMAAAFMLLDEKEINKMINEFVAANFKK